MMYQGIKNIYIEHNYIGYQLIPICSAPHLKIYFTEMRGAELCEDITILCPNLMKTSLLA